MSSDAADEDAINAAGLSGAVMHEAIRQWIASMYDGESCVVTRFVVCAEADDGEARWVEVGAFGSDGWELPEWESLGLLDYAKRVQRGEFSHANDEDHDA